MLDIADAEKSVDVGGVLEPVGIHVADFVSIGRKVMREIPAQSEANLSFLSGRETHSGCQRPDVPR